MDDSLIVLLLLLGSTLGTIILLFFIDKRKNERRYFIENEIVRLYSLCTNNLNRELIYINLKESEHFKQIMEQGKISGGSLANLLIIVNELKARENYPEELNLITEDILSAVMLTEKMLVSKGVCRILHSHVKKKYRRQYWKD